MAARRLLYLVPLAIFGVMVVYLAAGLRIDPKVVPSALIDKPVPTFTLPSLEGWPKPGFSDASFTDGVAVVNVFASWCIPCKAEHPLITRLAGMKVAAVYGLNYKDEPTQAVRWLKELGDPYQAIGADRDGRVGIEWGVYGVPETFVIDAAGRIRHKLVGPMTAEAFEREILPAIRALQP